MTDRTPWGPARPTTYKGIRMRSRLEAEYAALLDRSGPGGKLRLIGWEYEPMCFAGSSGQYLPDFRIDFLSSRGPLVLYVEVKSVVGDPLPIMRRMEVIWESEPDVQLMIEERRGECRNWTARSGSDWKAH